MRTKKKVIFSCLNCLIIDYLLFNNVSQNYVIQ